MQNPTVTTSVSTVSINKEGIVDWCYNAGAEVRLEEAVEETTLVSDLITENGGEGRLLIDIRQIGSITREARAHFASDETSDLGAVGLALLVDSVFSKVIGNFYMTISRPKHTTRLFTNKKMAIEWLSSLPKLPSD